MLFDYRKACRSLAEVQSVQLEAVVLSPANHVGRFQSFEKFVLTTAKHVGGLYSVGECVLTTTKHVGG